MLIEFRVKNFRSLRDEQTLSLVATTDKTLQHSHTVESGAKAASTLLRSAVIYGANASGKSNLIKALQNMAKLVIHSSANLAVSQHLDVRPFRLDESSANQPIEFEVTFVLNDVRHQYGFALLEQRIIKEYLLVYKAAKPQRWFERYYDPETGRDAYELGSSLKGQKHVWEQATRPDALFLSTAVQLNSEQLRPIFDWFDKHLRVINDNAPLSIDHSIQLLRQDTGKKAICDLLKTADISIDDIDVIVEENPAHTSIVLFTDLINKRLTPERKPINFYGAEQYKIRFHHKTPQGRATFDLDEESSGTRSLLFTLGPMLEALEKGSTLFIDELDTSLHTLLVQHLVRLFHNPQLNPHGAQLVFTTHDTALLSKADLFRRDQIWFVEKDIDQASTLYPLSDFSPRKNEALERGYLMGRYGGLPLLNEWEPRR